MTIPTSHYKRAVRMSIRRGHVRYHDPDAVARWDAVASRAECFRTPVNGLCLPYEVLAATEIERPIRLPFPDVSIEYQSDYHTNGRTIGNGWHPRAVVALASEAVDYEADGTPVPIIVVAPAWRLPGSEWAVCPPSAFKASGGVHSDGKVLTIELIRSPEAKAAGLAHKDYMDEVLAITSLVMALGCSNVTARRVPPTNLPQPRAGALPFDDYHELFVSTRRTSAARSGIGTHRSPREHLRRGHIRRLPDTRRIWVNSCLVAAGSEGRITKDYRVV